MPLTTVVEDSGSIVVDTYVYSLQFTMLGASGGGENVNNDTYLTADAGTSGGTTSFLGVSATGGTGGGIGGKNTASSGGEYSLGSLWAGTGVVFTVGNGAGGSLSSGGTGGENLGRSGGNGSDGYNTYTSSSTHYFNNSPDTTDENGVPPKSHNFSSSGSTDDISMDYFNPGAVGQTGATNPNGKHYGFTFTSPYIDNNWTYTITSNFDTAAGGGQGGRTYAVSGIDNKTANGMKIWFKTATGGNTYIRDFIITTVGTKAGARGRGGGGGAYISTNAISRATLESKGFTAGLETLLSIGSAGTAGGSDGNCSDGTGGRVTVVQVIYPQVYLTASVVSIILGGTVDLQWYSAGDLNAIRWPSNADISNGNIESNSTVTPTATTTYRAEGYNTGNSELVSFNPESSVTITVYEQPRADKFVTPLTINYGVATIDVEYEVYYANTELKLEVFKSGYDRGPNQGNTVLHQTINLTLGGTAEAGQTALGKSSGIENIPVVWDDYGPRSYVVKLTANGNGGSFILQNTIAVVIDETPDNLVIEESEDLFKDEVPVINPESEILSEFYQINGIDIPVEILSDWPINVDIDKNNDWKQIRQI
ncbi:virion structural protein [Synechococcus phage ACG-2014i]|uniref:Virion structural protein n=1 Tax=Synechococcus phage ACG-2014i TaxID=1493513 RepID=A0A0E3FHL0_9CAUD|nr:virion structural protein [Synechococcus phage ACG-2014i]AIX26754.1 virion structural protein [Synechococcus phage ACG-2014i]